ncbi:MAG: branched-chain amino acid ABC transporter permease [Nitrospirota bacterium]|jgi:branched-chain amino acid transport system permease protein
MMANIKKLSLISIWLFGLTFPFVGIANAFYFFIITLFISSIWLLYKAMDIKLPAGIILPPRLKRGLDRKGARITAAAILAIPALLLPFFTDQYITNVAITAVAYIALAIGLNIVVGFAGLLDLGYVAFYAVGAYLFALLSTGAGLSFWAALPLAAIVAAAFGVLLGFPTLRLRGDYLAIVTLGFGEMIRITLNNWDSLTGGPNGILGIAAPSLFGLSLSQPAHYYYLIILLVLFTIFAANRLNNSRIGRAWIAIREDEIAAEAMGINIVKMKLLAFALGASFAGIAGAFFASRMRFVSPESFTFFESVIILSMVILGGMGSIPGVILGAVVLVILPESLRGFQNYRMIIFGSAMVLMMIFRPQGFIGSTRRRLELHPDDEKILQQETESLYDVEKR